MRYQPLDPRAQEETLGMRPSPSSNARLRTRTGCLECRKRRKKCDENPPRCSGCTRNLLKCTWPTDSNQAYDSRTSRGLLRKLQSHVRSPYPQLQQTIETPLNSSDHSKLFAHFACVIYPNLLRPAYDPELNGKEYFLRLAFQFPPLMGTVIAIAALHVDPLRYQQLALEFHTFALQDLQSRLAISRDAGSEDGLLATTIFLCVFETSQRRFQPNIGAHASAASVLLSRRNSPHQAHSSPRRIDANAIFEQICAESLLYHSTLMMLFDPSLDALYHSEDTITFIRHFFDDDKEPEGGSQATEKPILATSHRFFLLISEVTRLARMPHPKNYDSLSPWACLQTELSQKEQDTPGDPGQQLFVLAMQILLLRVHLRPSSDESATQITALLSCGLTLLDTLDTREYFSGYLLWPLTVFGSVASQDHERIAIEKSINRLAERQYGQAIRIHNWLHSIWAVEHGNKPMTMISGLKMLLDDPSTPLV